MSSERSIAQTPWEDHLLERKTERQLADIRRTAVAFANSVKPGHTAVILIGESNDGTVSGVSNPDDQQRKLRQELEKIFPAIVWRQSLYTRDNQTCIRIEIDHCGDTPHFGDAAWIRHGSETVKASDLMLQRLVELRSSKVRKLSEWIDKKVTVSWVMGNERPTGGPNWGKFECKVIEVNGDFATFALQTGAANRKSEPLAWLELSWDDASNRLRVFVNPDRSAF
jgi:hypothetical protein